MFANTLLAAGSFINATVCWQCRHHTPKCFSTVNGQLKSLSPLTRCGFGNGDIIALNAYIFYRKWSHEQSIVFNLLWR
jgi:hypothetical protein